MPTPKPRARAACSAVVASALPASTALWGLLVPHSLLAARGCNTIWTFNNGRRCAAIFSQADPGGPIRSGAYGTGLAEKAWGKRASRSDGIGCPNGISLTANPSMLRSDTSEWTAAPARPPRSLSWRMLYRFRSGPWGDHTTEPRSITMNRRMDMLSPRWTRSVHVPGRRSPKRTRSNSVRP